MSVLLILPMCEITFGQNPLFVVDTGYLSKHDIVYKTPAYEGFEGLPVGNGDMGGMVWNTNNGVAVQINKNDLFDQTHEEARSTLRGGARLNIDLGAPVFEWMYLDDFDGRLSLKNAEVVLNGKTPFMASRVNTWVAPNKNIWCSVQKEKEAHQKWWKDYWSQSFVNLENDYIENIYYFRRYLMGSSSRGKFPVMFNGGLWTWNHDVRNWVTPHHWNTQQQYWGLCAQNDCELMLPYLNTYFKLMPHAEEHAKKRGAENAILWGEPHDFFGSMTFWDRADMLNNFTPASQMAGLFWEYYQYTGDKNFLAQKAYPFMKKAAEFYMQKLQWDSLKNQYFIFPSQAYESPRSNQLKNPVTDRNMIIANFSNCINAAKILNADPSKIKQWQFVIEHMWQLPYRTVPNLGEVIELAWYPNDSIFPKMNDHGRWLNAMSQNTSLVFPAGVIGIDQVSTREYKAVSNIVSHHSPMANAISPEPIVAARLGMGNDVLRMMQNGIRRLQHFPQGLFYNIDHWYNLSLYMDSLKTPDITAQRDYIYDERAHYPNKLPAKPFIQCGLEPLSIYGAAVNEMLLQSNEGKIRIFPAIPNGWATSFRLLARGAFMVSSERQKNGTIQGIYIESQKGNECRLVNPWADSEVAVWSIGEKNKKVSHKILEKNVVVFSTLPNQNYLIVPKGKEGLLKQTIYKGIQNDAPKSFFEATLGKSRNF